jgi:hypothetical protein
MNKTNKNIYIGFTCLLLLAVAGCVPMAEMFQGNSVSSGQLVAIQETGLHEGHEQNFDIIISYEFVRDGDVLEISGHAILTDRYPRLYDSLKYMYVYLFFLDDASRVLTTVSLASSLANNIDERFEFSQSLKVPSGAVAISFGYDGLASEGGGRDGGSYAFYRLPLK